MAGTPVDLGALVTPITDSLTSATAFTAYGTIAAVGVAIGTGVKMGPKLFRYIWKYIPS